VKRPFGRNVFHLAVGSAGIFLIGLYLLIEYVEYGGQGLYLHLTTEMKLEHLLMFLLIPLFATLGHVMERRTRFIDMYSKNLEESVEERTAELEATLKRHESYVFSVADGLRNPLQVFVGNIEEIDTSNFTPEQKKTFTRIKNAADLLQENISLLTDRVGIERAERIIWESEKKEKIHQNFIENSNDAMYIVDLKGNFTYVNRTATRLMGYTREELLGKNISEFLYPDGLKTALAHMAAVTAGRKIGHHELVVKSAHGDRIGELSITLLMEGLKPVGILGIARDVTEKKKTEERYQRLVEFSPDAIVVHSEGKLVYANPAAARLVGAASPEEIVGKPIMDFVHPDYHDIVKKRVRKAQDEGKVVEPMEEKFIRLDGQTIDVETVAIPITYKDKPASQVIIRDITGRKRTEEALKESEERYRELIDNASDVMYTLDLEGNITSANAAAERLYGYSRDELLNLNMSQLIDPEYLPVAQDNLKKKIQGVAEKTGPYELLTYTKDGSPVWVEVNTRAIKKDGRPVGIQGILRDITERKEMEEKLWLFMEVVEEAPDGIQIVGLDGRIIYCNKAVEGIYGFSPEELEEKHINEMNVDPEFGSNVIIPNIEQAGHWAGEVMVKHKDGHEFPIWLAASMVKDKRGEPIAMVGINVDITEHKRAEMALKKYSEELEESNKLKQLFNDILSHDLSNPLGVVESYADLILEKGGRQINQEYLEAMGRSLRKARGILKDANTYMRLRDIKELEFGRLKITSIIREALEDFESHMKEKEMGLEFDPEREVTIPGSPILKEVFSNLISNAIKYSPQGSTLGIEIEEGETVRVIFRDQGAGISDEDKERIFQRFERLEKGVVKGVGLGLAIVKRVVELHKGKVWVEDNPDGGSIFIVELPRKP
jgi:PAS domain S-box-containing protein